MCTCIRMDKLDPYDIHVKYVKQTFGEANLIIPIGIAGRNDRKLCMLPIVLQVKMM